MIVMGKQTDDGIKFGSSKDTNLYRTKADKLVGTDQRVDEIREKLISLLHKHDHEPDEITKYVVIDQTEIVPDLIDLIAQEVEAAQATRIDQYLQENPLQAPQLLAAVIYNTFMEKTNATKANMKIKNFSKNGDIKGDLSIEATLTNNTKGKK